MQVNRVVASVQQQPPAAAGRLVARLAHRLPADDTGIAALAGDHSPPQAVQPHPQESSSSTDSEEVSNIFPHALQQLDLLLQFRCRVQASCV